MTRAALAVVALLVAAGGGWGGCAWGGSAAREPEGAWRKAPAPPLGPREHALGVWTGREVLILAGSDARPCPPGASCRAPARPPLRDGAAFDPAGGSWRRLADAPAGFDFATAAVVGRTVFVVAPGESARPGAPSAALAYRVDRDRWLRLPLPPRPTRNYTLVAAGGRMVVYDRGGGRRAAPGYVLSRDRRSWRPLPPAPLPATHGQSMAWSGRELVLFRSAPVGRRAQRPPLARAAALSLRSRRWRRLPDSDTVLFGPYWIRVGSRLINPALGIGDEEYRWGRPHGGILDPGSGVWSDLPNPPEPGPFVFGAGVLTESRGYYLGPGGGWLLDVESERWIRIPRLDGSRSGVQGRAIADAGRQLMVFGGAKFSRRSPGGRLLGGAWIWSPPRE